MSDKIQLFILPYAGGNAFSFNKLVDLLDKRIDAVPIEYSGRGRRIEEGYIEEYTEFFNDVVTEIEFSRNINGSYAIFGYSMGAALAYEIVAKRVLGREPIHLFYGARACIKTEKLPDMSDDDFVEYSKTLGGFNEKLTSNKRLFNLFIHPLKDDYHVAKQYRFSLGQIPNCNTTVFYSEKDTPFTSVKGWEKLTNGTTTFYELGDNHFFVNSHYFEMADIINTTLIGGRENE